MDWGLVRFALAAGSQFLYFGLWRVVILVSGLLGWVWFVCRRLLWRMAYGGEDYRYEIILQPLLLLYRPISTITVQHLARLLPRSSALVISFCCILSYPRSSHIGIGALLLMQIHPDTDARPSR
jgi:hypothetical protein